MSSFFQWIRIRHQWYYWFVVLDADTELPVYQAVLATHSAASVTWIVMELRRLKQLPRVCITDGLAAYTNVKEIRGMAEFLTTEEATA